MTDKPDGAEHSDEDVDLDEFEVDVPAGDDEHPMTLRELREAIEDESHPRHAEAVQRNKELAEQLRPAMDRLRQTVFEQSGMKETLARIQAAAVPATSFKMPKFDIAKVDLTNPVLERQQEWQRSMQEQQRQMQEAAVEVAESRARRQRLEDQRAEQTLDVLASMDAHLAQLNGRIESVDAKIEAGNKSSSKVAGWTILVAVLTLLATVVGIVVTVLLSR